MTTTTRSRTHRSKLLHLVVVVALAMLTLCGLSAPAVQATPTGDEYVVCGYWQVVTTSWHETPGPANWVTGAAHGTGYESGYLFSYTQSAGWQPIGEMTYWFRGNLNITTDVTNHHGTWELSSPVIGDFTGSWVMPITMYGDTAHGVGASVDGKAHLTFDVSLDAIGYPELPWGGYCSSVSIWTVTH